MTDLVVVAGWALGSCALLAALTRWEQRRAARGRHPSAGVPFRQPSHVRIVRDR